MQSRSYHSTANDWRIFYVKEAQRTFWKGTAEGQRVGEVIFMYLLSPSHKHKCTFIYLCVVFQPLVKIKYPRRVSEIRKNLLRAHMLPLRAPHLFTEDRGRVSTICWSVAWGHQMHCSYWKPNNHQPQCRRPGHRVQPLITAPSISPSLDNHTEQHTRIDIGDEDKDQTVLEMSWRRLVNNRPP